MITFILTSVTILIIWFVISFFYSVDRVVLFQETLEYKQDYDITMCDIILFPSLIMLLACYFISKIKNVKLYVIKFKN